MGRFPKRHPRLAVLSALLLFLGAPTVALAVLGDVDGNGSIEAADAQLVLESVVGTATLTTQESRDADVDGDGDVDVFDAHLIQQFAEAEITRFPPLPQASAPVAITRTGLLVAVVNPDSNTVTFVETVGDTVVSEVAVGREPMGVSFSLDGMTAYVTNARDGNVSVVDVAGGLELSTIPVGIEPFGVVVSYRGDRAFVSNFASQTVSVLDLSTETEIAVVPVAEKPQGLAVTSDSRTVYVTHLNGGEVTVIDAETFAASSIALSDLPFDAQNPALVAGSPNRMKGGVLHPVDGNLWLPHLLSNADNTVETLFDTSVFPAITQIDGGTQTELPGSPLTLFAGLSTPVSSPEALAFSPDGTLAYVVSSSSNDLTVVNVALGQEVGLLRDVGDNPRGIVVTPDGTKAYVFNRLSPVLSVVDLGTETLLASLAVSVDTVPANLSNGRRVFFTTALPEVAQDRILACESCHFDGRDDGRTWFFTNGPRQTQSMAGGTLETGLMHHAGDRQDLQDFLSTFTRLQNGTGPSQQQLDDMADWVNVGLRFFESPHLAADGSRSASARRGRRIFESSGCADCHTGAFFTDAQGETDLSNPRLHDVGTFVAGTGSQDEFDRTRDQPALAGGTVRPAGSFETSYLLGVWATPPYLHDASAATLEEVLTTANPSDLHGVTSGLSAAERTDLVQYLLELDLTNSRVRIEFPADGARVVDLLEVRGSVLPDVLSVDVIVDGGSPIAAVVAGGSFTAAVPVGALTGLSDGTLFDITAVAATATGEPGRDDVELEANTGGAVDATLSTVDAQPALILADGTSTSDVTITPLDGLGSPVGSGLVIEAATTQGSLGAVVDNGDGTYGVVLTSSIAASVATVTANEQGGAVFTDDASVTFAAGDVDAATSSVSVSPTTVEASAAATASVTVVPLDAFLNGLGAGLAVVVSADVGSVGPVMDGGDGTYTAVFSAPTAPGTATISATVDGTPLTTQPTVTLTPDTTAPADADLERISFGTPDGGGNSEIVGGEGSVEAFAQVVVTNEDTLASVTVTAGADGSFSATLGLDVNERVSVRVDDAATNMSTPVETVPFFVETLSIQGVVQTIAVGGGFDPLPGELVELDIVDQSIPEAPAFIPVLSQGNCITATSDGSGNFEILFPTGFVPDPDLAVVNGFDIDLDGCVDSDQIFAVAFVNDEDRTVEVDEVGTVMPFLIGFNDLLLCEDPPGCTTPPFAPVSNFCPDERLAVEAAVRAATTEIDFTINFDPFQDIADDVFFDLDGPKDALDQAAFDTFQQAAETSDPCGAPETLIEGTVTVPGSGGNAPLSGVTVELANLSLDPFNLSFVSGATAVTDGTGSYSLSKPGYVATGSATVVVVRGDLDYDGAGLPGSFVAGPELLLLNWVTRDGIQIDIDLPAAVALDRMAAVAFLESAPIGNFTPPEVEQLVALVRTKLAGASLTFPNQSLADVFAEAVALMSLDTDVNQLLQDIVTANTTFGNVSANPVTLDADGVSVSVITVEPLDAFLTPLGAGLTVELSTNLGTVTSPAIDELDGFYTALLYAPTTAGDATVSVTVDGVTLAETAVVTFTADTTAPSAPDAGRIVQTGSGGTLTLVGLPGAVEGNSQVTVENTTTGDEVTVTAAADGSFRVNLLGTSGDNLVVRAEDGSLNASTDTGLVVGTGVTLPAIGNPSAVPGGVTATLTALAEADLGAAVPAGYSFLEAFDLDLEGSAPTAPLDVIAASTVAVSSSTPVLLVQEIEVLGVPELRAVAPALAAGGILFPLSGSGVPGVAVEGRYAYLAADAEQAFALGTVSGTGGAIEAARVTLTGSPFVDLTRADGSYLLAGDVGSSGTLEAQTHAHVAGEPLALTLPYADAFVTRDFNLATRATRSFAFTGRFQPVGQVARRLVMHPSGDLLYVLLSNSGDIAIYDTASLSNIKTAIDSQAIVDMALTPNGQKGFVGYLSRARDFNVPTQEPGLLFTDVFFPRDLAITPNGDLGLVASSIDNSDVDTDADDVFVINVLTNTVEPTSLPVPADPEAIAVNHAGTRAYVVSRTQGTLTVIDVPGRAVIDTLTLGGALYDVAVSLDDSELYVANESGDSVIALDALLAEDLVPGNETLATVPVGDEPRALALSRDGATLLVAERQDDTLSVLDLGTLTVTGVLATVDTPTDVVVHPDGTRAFTIDSILQQGFLEIDLEEADTLAPTVVDVGPEDRVGSLLQDSPVEIVFDEKMDAATLTLANLQVLDALDAAIPGTLAVQGIDTSVVFTPDPGVRYELNSTLKVDLGTGLTDAAGNALAAPEQWLVPTQAMQLPNSVLISLELDGMGITAIGDPGAVEPESLVEITNLLTATVFSATAGTDGSFSIPIEGLDTDGYELVTSIFEGRAKTDPVPVLVNFTIQLANASLVTYQAPASSLEAVGAAGAVDPKCSEVRIRNTTLGPSYSTSTINPDGSFLFTIVARPGDALELICTILGAVELEAVPLDELTVSLNTQDPVDGLISFQPGLAGTLQAVGAAGAVDNRSSKLTLYNLTKSDSFETTAVNPDGSFTMDVLNVEAGDQLEIVATILDAFDLNPVIVTNPGILAPVLDFLTPSSFAFGDAVNISVVGEPLGTVAANLLLEVGGIPVGSFVLDTLDEDPSKQVVVFTLPAGSETGTVEITLAGLTSNVLTYSSQRPLNGSRYGEEIISSFTVGDPAEALGVANGSYVDLGEGGEIVIRLGSLMRDGAGSDFQIFEDTSDGEDCYDVYVSPSSTGPFDLIGQFCGTAFVDMSGHGPGAFVRIVDAADGGPAAGIDAVRAIRVALSSMIEVSDEQGNMVMVGGGAGTGGNVSATIDESQFVACAAKEMEEGDPISLSPMLEPPLENRYYGPRCTDTFKWTVNDTALGGFVSGGGLVSTVTTETATFKTKDKEGTATLTFEVTRSGNSSCPGQGSDSLTVTVDIAKILVKDEAGDEVHGVATDGLAAAGGGQDLPGAKLSLELTGQGSASIEWGYVPSGGSFAELPMGKEEGVYEGGTTGATATYLPPLEFTLAGASTDAERDPALATKLTLGSIEKTCQAEMILVRPPVVIVHGINSAPGPWAPLGNSLDAKGFKSYLADHSGAFSGNGNIHTSYGAVRDKVLEALDDFRAEAGAFPDKKIAVEKVDLVAHSYGGLLSRWYVEQANDYDDDVRKLVTLGTPHKGAPITNMLLGAANRAVIRDAATVPGAIPGVADTIEDLLRQLESNGFVRWTQSPGSYATLPAHEVMSLGSDVVGDLNSTPFSDDVAYASVVGTADAIFGVGDLHKILEPLAQAVTVIPGKSYYPWLRILDEGNSDSTVPTWSQRLPARSANIAETHIGYPGNGAVQNQVRDWLEDETLPRGAAHRPAFTSAPITEPTSHANAMVGASLVGSTSTGGGLEDLAIVQVTLSGPTLDTSSDPPVLGSNGGIVTVTGNGMGRAGTPLTVDVVRDAGFPSTGDETLETLVATATGSAPSGQLYTIEFQGRIARSQAGSIVGPDASSPNMVGGAVWDVGYEMPDFGDFGQSPPVQVEFPDYALPAPVGPGGSPPYSVGAGGASFSVEGGVNVTATPGTSQTLTVKLYDDELLDDLLDERSFSTTVPSDAWLPAGGGHPNILVPYSDAGFSLFKNGSGHVAGPDGSSGESSAEVFQQLTQPGAMLNPSSPAVTVNAAP